MKFFSALKKLYNYLTEEETPVVYEGPQETTEKQTMIEIKNPYVLSSKGMGS
jgi:ribosome biogenesis protein Nip4